MLKHDWTMLLGYICFFKLLTDKQVHPSNTVPVMFEHHRGGSSHSSVLAIIMLSIGVH